MDLSKDVIKLVGKWYIMWILRNGIKPKIIKHEIKRLIWARSK